jgi:hypothetical protein
MTPPPGPNYALRVELAQILGVDLKDLPPVFRGNKPRTIDIDAVEHQIRLRYPHVDRVEMRDFLDRYTANWTYLNKMLHGHHLHDLDGATTREISTRMRRAAKQKIAFIRREKKLATNRYVESVATEPLTRIGGQDGKAGQTA